MTQIGAYGPGLRLHCTGDRVEEVAALVVGAGLRLRRLQPVENTLESLYLELLGGEGTVARG